MPTPSPTMPLRVAVGAVARALNAPDYLTLEDVATGKAIEVHEAAQKTAPTVLIRRMTFPMVAGQALECLTFLAAAWLLGDAEFDPLERALVLAGIVWIKALAVTLALLMVRATLIRGAPRLAIVVLAAVATLGIVGAAANVASVLL